MLWCVCALGGRAGGGGRWGGVAAWLGEQGSGRCTSCPGARCCLSHSQAHSASPALPPPRSLAPNACLLLSQDFAAAFAKLLELGVPFAEDAAPASPKPRA